MSVETKTHSVSWLVETEFVYSVFFVFLVNALPPLQQYSLLEETVERNKG
jgi:hypothetical protein